MATDFYFHPEAFLEYAESTNYYLQNASSRIADGFVMVVETAVANLVAAPTRWPVIEDPDIRRYVLNRFPFVIYYRWEPQQERVTIYALMHCSRKLGYWHHRVEHSD